MVDDRTAAPGADLRLVPGTPTGVERDYRRLFVFAPDAHLVTDVSYRITDANRRAATLFRMPRRRLVSRSLVDLVAEPDRALLHAHVEQLVHGRRLLSPEWDATIVLPGTDELVASLRTSAMRAGGQEVTHLHWTLRDVTETRQALADLQAAFGQERLVADHLRELDRWQHAFTAAASHDLRSPLAGIRAFAETLLERDADLTDEQRHQFLRRIMHTTDRITRLLDNLRDLDRATRGLVEVVRAPTDLAHLVRDVVEEVDLHDHEVQVSTEEIILEVDAERVGQAIAHLVDNAVSHTPAGTPVRVHLAGDAAGARLTVEDEGPGVPDEVSNRLFAPFVSHPVAGSEAGNGLGLSLVALFVEMHGGTVDHERPSGGGARFVVELPGPA